MAYLKKNILKFLLLIFELATYILFLSLSVIGFCLIFLAIFIFDIYLRFEKLSKGT